METIHVKGGLSNWRIFNIFLVSSCLVIFFVSTLYDKDFEENTGIASMLSFVFIFIANIVVIVPAKRNFQNLEKYYPSKNNIVEIPTQEIISIYGTNSKRFIITTKGDLDITSLRCINPLNSKPISKNDFPEIKFESQISLLNQIGSGLFLIIAIGAIFYLTFGIDESLKYWLPLKKIEVVEIKATLSKAILIGSIYYPISPQIQTKEYGNLKFVFPDEEKLRSKKRPFEDMVLQKSDEIILKIRKKDFERLKQPITQSIRFYSLEHEGEVIFEKDKLSD